MCSTFGIELADGHILHLRAQQPVRGGGDLRDSTETRTILRPCGVSEAGFGPVNPAVGSFWLTACGGFRGHAELGPACAPRLLSQSVAGMHAGGSRDRGWVMCWLWLEPACTAAPTWLRSIGYARHPPHTTCPGWACGGPCSRRCSAWLWRGRCAPPATAPGPFSFTATRRRLSPPHLVLCLSHVKDIKIGTRRTAWGAQGD